MSNDLPKPQQPMPPVDAKFYISRMNGQLEWLHPVAAGIHEQSRKYEWTRDEAQASSVSRDFAHGFLNGNTMVTMSAKMWTPEEFREHIRGQVRAATELKDRWHRRWSAVNEECK